jgi:hypothetical protein
MDVLLDRQHHFRSGWRFGIFIVLFLLLWVAAGLALSLFFTGKSLPDTQLTLLLLNAAALFLPAIGATFFMVRIVDRAPFAAFGISFHSGWFRDWLAGLGVSAGMLGVLTAAALLFGGGAIRWTGSSISLGKWIATALLLMVAAANEEIVFRGYPMQALMKGIGPWPAVIAMSILFGLLHLANPDASTLSTLNTVLAGLLLSVAYLKTRSLWLPYGIHLGWNLGLGIILGYPVSGLDMVSLWSTLLSRTARFFGGPYGPEGGIIGTIIFVLAVLTVRFLPVPRVSPETRLVLLANAEKIYISEN